MERTQNVQNYFLSRPLNLQQENRRNIDCLENIKNIPKHSGLSNIYLEQTTQYETGEYNIELTLIDQFKQNWKSTVHSSPKALN